MTEQLAIALVSSLGVVLVAGFGYLGILAQQTKKLAHDARTQVTNSHQTNFRDDVTAIAKVQTEQGEVLAKLSDNQDHITQSMTLLWSMVGKGTPNE